MAPFFWALLVSSTLLCVEGDILDNAYDEAKFLYYEDIYLNASFYFDMEDTEILTLNEFVDISCQDVLQTIGLLWHVSNSAMGFNSSDSYLRYNGSLNLDMGMTVSLWVKRLAITGTCSIWTVEVNNRTLQLSTNDTGVYMQSNCGFEEWNGMEWNVTSVFFISNNTWDWNIMSITINESGIVCFFMNGIETQCINCLNIRTAEESSVSITLNQPDGCQGLVVDEVAMWSRALNMSELVALRVQPFNRSSQLHLNTSPGFSSTAPMTTVCDAQCSEEKYMNKLKDTLSSLTEKDARVAFVNLASDLLELAVTSSHAIPFNTVTLIDIFENALSEVYFDNDFPNESIFTDYIKVHYVNLDETDLDTIYQVPKTNVTFTIPSNNFVGDKKMLVIVYNSAINSILNNSQEEPIVTDIISLQLPSTKDKPLASPIDIRMEVTLVVTLVSQLANGTKEPSCKYLDLSSSRWETTDVMTKRRLNDTVSPNITCHVSHLTNFAVLMSPIELEDNNILSVLTYIFLTISIICLLITLVVLMCLREIGSTQRVQILKQFIIALLMAQLLFVLTSELLVKEQVLCKVAASLSHYFWLSTFTWMLVQGVQLYTKVRRLSGNNIKQLFYIMFAWGFPQPIALIPLIITLSSGEEFKVCWLPPSLIWLFAVPAFLVFCVNVTVTILIMKTFLTVKVNKDKSQTEKLKSSVRAVVVMIPILGLTWISGFAVTIFPKSQFFQYMFVIMNPLQGVFVFVFHLVLNNDVRNALLKRRNQVAASTENTIFTKMTRTKNSDSSTTKDPLPSDTGSSANM